MTKDSKQLRHWTNTGNRLLRDTRSRSTVSLRIAAYISLPIKREVSELMFSPSKPPFLLRFPHFKFWIIWTIFIKFGIYVCHYIHHKIVIFFHTVLNNDEVRGEWRILHNEELNYPCSANIIRVSKSRRISWVGHVACMGRGEVYRGFWWGNPREREHL